MCVVSRYMVLSIIYMVRKYVKKFSRVQSILFLIVSTVSIHAEIFETLDVLKKHIKNLPLEVPIDNQDYLNPIYTSYLQAQEPTFIDKMLTAVGLKRKSSWKASGFLDLIRRVTKQRQKGDMRGNFIQRQEVSQDDHFLIWGSLHGAYHSLVVTLEHLVEQKIIDNNLKIIAPKYFMVFSGNVVDRSVYSLETLAIVLRLMEANPTRVFYTKGNHEYKGEWQNHDLREELESKVAVLMGKYPPYKGDIVPFTDDMDAFFDTLPIALFLGMKTVDSANLIRIGHFTRDFFHLSHDETLYVGNTDQTIVPIPISLPQKRENEKPAEIIAITEGSSDVIPNYSDQGLRLLPPDTGMTAWSILSAQNYSFEKLYKFFNDSYVDITIALPLKKSTITQHYQDARNRTGFKTGRVYNMFSGQADEQYRAQPKIDILKIGATLGLQGSTAMLSQQVRLGMSLAINKQNQQGISAGTIVSMVMLNDDALFAKMRRNIENLYKNYGARILLGVEENAMSHAYYDLIKKYNLLVLFPFVTMKAMRTAQHTSIIHYGPSFTEEAEISTRYILDTITPDKIMIFYEKNSIGENGIEGVRAACKSKGFKALVEVPFDSGELNFKGYVNKIQKEKPNIIGLFTSSSTGQEFIRQIGAQTLGKSIIYGLSSFGSESFRQYYQERGLRVITTNLIPDPFKSELSIAQDYRKDAADNNLKGSPQMFEAYVIASIFVEALRITKGAITADAIKQTLESMNNHDFKGLKLTFNKKTRELSDAIWLDVGDGSVWQQFTARKYELPTAKKAENGQAKDKNGQKKSTVESKAQEPVPQEKPVPEPIQKEVIPAPKVPEPVQEPVVPEPVQKEVIPAPKASEPIQEPVAAPEQKEKDDDTVQL